MTINKSSSSRLINPLKVAVEANVASVQETSGIKRVDSGICPTCNNRMENIIANGIPAYVCMKDRVVLPREDD